MLTSREIDRRLRSDPALFAPLRVVATERELAASRGRLDLVVELEWEGERRRFAVEYTSVATPKLLEIAMGEARRAAVDDLRPMVVAPYLSPERMDRLKAEGISGVDLSGNAVILVPGSWLIYRTGAENRFPASAPIKAIYSGTSSLVGRAFLSRRTFSKVAEIKEEIERLGGSISLGTVSKVLKGLEENLIVAKRPEIRLLQPDRLLDLLAENYSPPDARRRARIRVDLDEQTLERMRQIADAEGVKMAGRAESVYGVTPMSSELSIYTTSIETILGGLNVPEATRFSNVELLETEDQRVYFDRRGMRGFVWISPVQAYLELARGGKREREIAEDLRSRIMEPS